MGIENVILITLAIFLSDSRALARFYPFWRRRKRPSIQLVQLAHVLSLRASHDAQLPKFTRHLFSIVS